MRPIVTEWRILSVCLSVTLVSPAKTAEPLKMLFGLKTRVGPGNHVLDESPDSPSSWAILRRKGRSFVKYRDTLRSSVQKQLNRSICSFGCGLGGLKEVQVQSYSPGGANVPFQGTLAPPTEPSICGGDAALCQITLPLVITSDPAAFSRRCHYNQFICS